MNVDFINMESGGVRQQPAVVPPKQPAPAPASSPKQPTPAAAPVVPAPTAKPPTPVPAPKPVVPQPAPSKPAQPAQIKPVPVNPAPVNNPITTPGPGSVKALINFYDSQGKASPIRPYSYSQAVKQG